MKREDRVFGALFVGLIALHLALMLSTRLFPFADIPGHLAAATIARHAGEPTNHLAEYYRLYTFLKPNTAHLAFCSLRAFPSVELANRIYLATCGILLPLSVLLALRKLGGNPGFALLSFLLVYNYNARWGFVGFMLAMPLVILFARFFVFDERGVSGAARAIGAAAFLALLYFVHLLAALFSLLVLLLASLLRGRGWLRAATGAALASLPLLILAGAWWLSEARAYEGPGLITFLSGYYPDNFAWTFARRSLILIHDNYHLFDGLKGIVAAAVFSLAIVAPAIVAFFAGRRSGAPSRAGAVFPLLFGALCCVLLLPNEIPQQAALYERFSSLLFLALILYGGSRAPARLRGGVLAVFASLAFAHFALWADYFLEFKRENAGFDRAFLRPAAADMRLAGLVYDNKYRGRPLYMHFPSYYIVWHLAPATAKITDYRFSPVRRRVGAPRLPGYLEWIGSRHRYDGRYRDMDYLLVRGPVRPRGFDLLRTAGRWSICSRAAPTTR